MDAAERELFEGAIRRATELSTGTELDAALEDLGWIDALEDDRRSAVSLLFESQGRAGVTSTALDRLLGAALGRPAPQDRISVVLPPLRHSEPPGVQEGARAVVHGLTTAALASADVVIAVLGSPEGDVALALAPDALERRPVHGLDPAFGLFEVSGVVDMADATPVDWSGAAALGQLALSHELVGVSRAMLELARLHALERIQFGRPIGSFQAVRHRLAESLVAIEAAAGLLDAVWDEPGPATSALAKGLAGRSARTVARHAQQVLAGIGFTTEHPFHLFFRRTVVLDQLLGAGSALTRQVGAGVLATGSLPATLPL
jgi:hypothetical protein